MSKSALKNKVLVLNKNWHPIAVCTVQDAVCKATAHQFAFVDGESYMVYDWENWTKEFNVDLEADVSPKQFIHTNRFKVKSPEIAVCYDYDDIPQHSVKLTKKNIYYRDGGMCQYTGKKLSINEFTVDHIKPSSRGGKSTWENLVTCDREVNLRKGDRLPQEAGLKLLSTPVKPRWNPIMKIIEEDKVPESWKKFLKK